MREFWTLLLQGALALVSRVLLLILFQWAGKEGRIVLLGRHCSHISLLWKLDTFASVQNSRLDSFSGRYGMTVEYH